jgi:hypothetical protein
MKKVLVLLFSLPLLVIAQNTVCFTIDPNPNTNDPALVPFTKYMDLMGGSTIATNNNTPLFYIYDDGTVEKTIIHE